MYGAMRKPLRAGRGLRSIRGRLVFDTECFRNRLCLCLYSMQVLGRRNDLHGRIGLPVIFIGNKGVLHDAVYYKLPSAG